jgi:hypothetical protein
MHAARQLLRRLLYFLYIGPAANARNQTLDEATYVEVKPVLLRL